MLQPTALLQSALPLLQPSAAFAVFSPTLQPLAEALQALTASKQAVMLQLVEPWLRDYQVSTPGTLTSNEACKATCPCLALHVSS